MQTTIEDLERKSGEVLAAARAVYAENHKLRELLAAFGGIARLVLEEVDRFAEDNGLLPPAERGEGSGEPATARRDWDGLGRPDDVVIARWAAEIDAGATSGDIAQRYGETGIRIGMLVSHWRRRQEAADAGRSERDAEADDRAGDLRDSEEESEFFEDESGGVR